MRNTVQRHMILDAVRSMDTHPTADEIYDEVNKKCPGISKGTVYRNLGIMAQDGDILRINVANAPDRFDRTTCLHAHVLCEKCGRVFDIDIPQDFVMPDVSCSRFTVYGYDLLFHGCCRSCRGDS